MVSVKELITHKSVFTVDRGVSVQSAVEYMSQKNIGAVSVMDGNRLVGIFSERDVINRVIAKGLSPLTTTVGSVMTTELVVANADESYESCLRKMKQANCRHLPIVDGENLLGIISLRDLLQIDITEKDDTIGFLNNYLFHIPPGLEKRYTK